MHVFKVVVEHVVWSTFMQGFQRNGLIADIHITHLELLALVVGLKTVEEAVVQEILVGTNR